MVNVRVLYISQTSRVENPILDPSTRYRCFNFAAELAKDSRYLVDVIPSCELRKEMVHLYDVFIFHRPFYSVSLEEFVYKIKLLGKKLFADYDDLIFDPDLTKDTSIYKNSRASFNDIYSSLNNNKKAMLLFDNIITSTHPLARHALSINPKAHLIVIHNGISEKWNSVAGVNYKKGSNRGERVIGYFCGTKSHDMDFKVIENSIEEFLRKHPESKLLLVGPLSFSSSIDKKRIMFSNLVPFYEMTNLISRCDVTIAPLEDTIFNNCKSCIKFLEAFSCGTICVATGIEDMVRNSERGAVVSKNSDWLNLLERSVYDTSFIKEKINAFKSSEEELSVRYESLKLKKEIER